MSSSKRASRRRVAADLDAGRRRWLRNERAAAAHGYKLCGCYWCEKYKKAAGR